MNPLTAACVLLRCLLLVALVAAAPRSSAFTAASERAKLLLEKLLRDVEAAQALTFDPAHTVNLQTMMSSLGIPPAPVLKPASDRFSLDTCVSRMVAGGALYQNILGVLSDRVNGLNELRADLRDLETQLNKMKEAAQLSSDAPDTVPDLRPRLHGDYEVQVALHLTLTQLRSFCHDAMRSLKTIATYRPRAAGAA